MIFEEQLLINFIFFFSSNYDYFIEFTLIFYCQYNVSYVKHDASYSRDILFTIFRLVTLKEISLIFKINSNFRHNHIAIYDFIATWFCSSFLVSIW